MKASLYIWTSPTNRNNIYRLEFMIPRFHMDSVKASLESSHGKGKSLVGNIKKCIGCLEDTPSYPPTINCSFTSILKPIWTYGNQLWGCVSKCNTQIIQRFQNKVLRNIVDAPRYFSNCNLHWDLGMDTVDQTISKIARNHEQWLFHHVKIEAAQLLGNHLSWFSDHVSVKAKHNGVVTL